MKTRATAIFTTAVTLTLAIAVLFAVNGPVNGAPKDKPGIFINITSGEDNLHAVSMALGLAKMSIEHGHKVVVFLNVHAPVFASKSFSADVKLADFPPVKQMLADAVDKGATVMVCDHCASVCNVQAADLIEGTTVSSHGDILEQLESGMVCFSY